MSLFIAEPPAALDRGRLNTRERLIAEAVRLFQARGVHGVGVAELLSASGATRGSLYHYFPDGKAQLARETTVWLADEIVGAIQALRLDGLDPSEILEEFARQTAAWLRKTTYSQSGLLSALTAGLGVEDELLAGSVETAYTRIEREHSRALTVAGLPAARAQELAREIVTVSEGAVILARANRDATVVTSQLAQVAARIRNELS